VGIEDAVLTACCFGEQRTFPGTALCDGTDDGEPRSEPRVFCSLDLLMAGVADLGLPADVRDGLYHRPVDEGCCQLLDIVL
jgi:hypothetical protein